MERVGTLRPTGDTELRKASQRSSTRQLHWLLHGYLALLRHVLLPPTDNLLGKSATSPTLV